jgi:hypothetical protein
MQDNPLNSTKPSENDMSLKDIILKLKDWIKYLLSRWYLILAFAIVGAVIGYWSVKDNRPLYTATTTFVLENGNQSGSGMGQYAGIASMMGVEVGSGGGLFQGENILELYKSRTMMSQTLLTQAKFDGRSQLLIDRFIEINQLRKKWKDRADLRNITFSTDNKYVSEKQQLLHDSIISSVVKNISKNYLIIGRPDKKLNIINITVRAPDEQFAKAFNETIVRKVNDFYLQTKTKKNAENVAILQHKTDSVKAAMTGSIYRAAQVADATPNINPTRQAQRIAPIQSAQANAKIAEGMLGQLISNLEMSKVALSKETPLIQVVDEPVLPLDKTINGKRNTIIIGALLGAMLMVFYLIMRRVCWNIMREKPVF